MPKAMATGLGAVILSAATAYAQGSVEPSVMVAGEAVYAQNCVMCHGAEGRSVAEIFPDLAGNEVLTDSAHIAANVLEGVAIMPPFPSLSDDDIAAVTTYVRNSFGNTLGAVSVPEVSAVRAEVGPTGPVRSIWDGVYTEAQATEGKQLFSGPCGLCHGKSLNGVPDDMDMRPAPPLARHKFLRVWEGRSLGALFSYTRWTMPQSNPGFLPDEAYAAMIAYMLATSGAPAGNARLGTDVAELGHILIRLKP
jgi:mono/diheme cytochrome c family protein